MRISERQYTGERNIFINSEWSYTQKLVLRGRFQKAFDSPVVVRYTSSITVL